VFTSSPHGCASGREGVDALLAASAYTEDICVVFIGDGVYQLLAGQSAQSTKLKDYAPMFKLFDLYDIEQVYVCQESLAERGLSSSDLMIDVEAVESEQVKVLLAQSNKVLTF
uniref:sulfurtransferase complex subunit TusC n=1 Tax=Vibrio mexicanus TaxID=1004326 RepID=UPI00063CBE19